MEPWTAILDDVNGDGAVDTTDLSGLSKAYGSTYQDPNCDFNGDGKVDV